MSLFLHLVIVEGSPTSPYLGASARPTMTGYDSLAFTRQTAERIVADLNRDACGLTGSWDGDSLVFTATEDYNGEAFTETITPNGQGHYIISALWPWGAWSKDLDSSEQHRAYARGALTPAEPADPTYSDVARAAWQRGRDEAAQVLQPSRPWQHRPHKHLVKYGPQPTEIPSATTAHPSRPRRQR